MLKRLTRLVEAHSFLACSALVFIVLLLLLFPYYSVKGAYELISILVGLVAASLVLGALLWIAIIFISLSISSLYEGTKNRDFAQLFFAVWILVGLFLFVGSVVNQVGS